MVGRINVLGTTLAVTSNWMNAVQICDSYINYTQPAEHAVAVLTFSLQLHNQCGPSHSIYIVA
jgi:hypothetical protein